MHTVYAIIKTVIIYRCLFAKWITSECHRILTILQMSVSPFNQLNLSKILSTTANWLFGLVVTWCSTFSLVSTVMGNQSCK